MASRVRGLFGLGVAAVLAGVGPASGQTPAVPATAQALRLPRVSFSVGMGVVGSQPATGATVRYAFDRHLVLEGDFTRWNGTDTWTYGGYWYQTYNGLTAYSGDARGDDTHRGWSGGANLLFQTNVRRLTWFGGGGVVYADAVFREVYTRTGCVTPPGAVNDCYESTWTNHDRGWGWQALTGVDLRVAGPVVVYGALHFTSPPVGQFRASVGLRITARSMDASRVDRARAERLARWAVPGAPEAAIGAQVRVTLDNGEQRRGTLVNFGEGEVVIRTNAGVLNQRSAEERYQLANVWVVETTHHKALKGMLWGIVGGAAVGVATSFACEDDFGYCALVLGSTFAGLGAGAGAAIGGLADYLAAPAHVVYARGGRSAQLIPLTTAKGVGLGLRLRW